MGYVSASVIPNISTSANFLARMKAAISDPIKGTGAVTQTADTGQINWATPVTPVAGAMAGYEMFAFADSLQATAPIFVKVEYGWNNLTSTPGMNVSVGTGTNGAGTLTSALVGGPLSLPVIPISSAGISNNSSAGDCFANGSAVDAALLWAGWLAGNSGGGMILIERSRDMDGTPSADGVVVQRSGWGMTLATNNAVAALECLRFSAGAAQFPYSRAVGMVMLPPAAQMTNNSIVGSTTSLYPYYTGMYGTSVGGPSKYVIGAHKGDIGPGAVITVAVNGVAQTFFACGTGLTGVHDVLGSTYAGISLCLRVS